MSSASSPCLSLFCSGEIFICPGFIGADTLGYETLSRSVNLNANLFKHPHYGYNWQNIGGYFNVPTSLGLTEEQKHYQYLPREIDIKQPAKTIVTTDSIRLDITSGPSRGTYIATDFLVSNHIAHARHTGPSTNVMWVDGHASTIKVTQEFDPYNTGLTERWDSNNLWDRN